MTLALYAAYRWWFDVVMATTTSDLLANFETTMTRQEYLAARNGTDPVEEVTNPCVVCGTELPPDRLRQKAKTCGHTCGEEYKRQRQKVLDARRGPRRRTPALQLRSTPGVVAEVHQPDRVTSLVLGLVGAGQRVLLEVDGVTLTVG